MPLRLRRAAAGIALAVPCLAIAVFSAQRDRSVPLFSSALRAEQVGEVVDRLAEWNVPFVALSDNVRIDAGRRNDVLLRLSLAGVPHAHVVTTSEALAKIGPLTPQTVLDVQQRAGLAGDLAAALRGLAGVQDAQVILAPAQDAAYAGETGHDASAAVRLVVRPGASLARAELDGIRRFVAAGVAGLEPARVALVDDSGLALGGNAPADEAQQLGASLQSALDAALGTGAAIVRVRIAYDPRARELHEIVRKPLGSRAIGTTTLSETYKSANKQYASVRGGEDRGSDVQDERIDVPPGRLERISVAVLVDSARHFDLEKIRAVATATLGLQPGRGDSLTVEDVAFATAKPRAFSRFAAMLGLAATVLPGGLIALGLAVAARFGAAPAGVVLAAVVRRADVAQTARAVAGLPAAHVRGALQDEPPHTAAAIISALPAATATAVLELYPPDERAAIVRRMARARAPAVPDYESVLRRG